MVPRKGVFLYVRVKSMKKKEEELKHEKATK